jgi:hypothetical protein
VAFGPELNFYFGSISSLSSEERFIRCPSYRKGEMNAVRNSVGTPAAVADFEEEISKLVTRAKADFEERAKRASKLAYVSSEDVPTKAFADAVVRSDHVYVVLGWTARLQEGFKLFDTTLSVTYETPAAFKLVVERTEVDVYYLGKEKYETVYGTTASMIWLPKSQIIVGKAFGLPFIRIPSWLAKKYPVLLRLAARAIKELAGVDA